MLTADQPNPLIPDQRQRRRELESIRSTAGVLYVIASTDRRYVFVQRFVRLLVSDSELDMGPIFLIESNQFRTQSNPIHIFVCPMHCVSSTLEDYKIVSTDCVSYVVCRMSYVQQVGVVTINHAHLLDRPLLVCLSDCLLQNG